MLFGLNEEQYDFAAYPFDWFFGLKVNPANGRVGF